MTMHPITNAEWVTSLRSGKFKQTKELLRDPDGAYCCLGVALKLCGYRWVKSAKDELFSARADLGLLDIKWNDESILAGMNDEGATFEEIADAIESGDIENAYHIWKEARRVRT